MGVLSEDFKEGYCDGHGQAVENVRYSIVEYLRQNKKISIDKANEICDMCSYIDYDYLNQ